MSSATARVSSILPFKRRFAVSSARQTGKKTFISTAMWRTMTGNAWVRGQCRVSVGSWPPYTPLNPFVHRCFSLPEWRVMGKSINYSFSSSHGACPPLCWNTSIYAVLFVAKSGLCLWIYSSASSFPSFHRIKSKSSLWRVFNWIERAVPPTSTKGFMHSSREMASIILPVCGASDCEGLMLLIFY